MRRSSWQNLVVDVQNRDVRTARLNIGFTAASTLIFGFENLAIFWIGAKIVIASQGISATPFTVGMLLAYIGYKNQFCSRMSSLINYSIDLRMLSLHAERLADILGSIPEPLEKSVKSLVLKGPSIEFRNVSFRYSDGEPWVLRNASFQIQSGESVAIVGPSGSGKTTLVKILLGVLPPTEGEVFFGGLSVSQIGIKNMRQLIGTVMQDDSLLTGTIEDNICCFDPDFDQKKIKECSVLANVHLDIIRMPMGYQTLVGSLGTGFSGGQKQRILIARALYKQPAALVLDEATSYLDVTAERRIISAINNLELTRLLIAHRPETISAAQRVLELRGGHLHERSI